MQEPDFKVYNILQPARGRGTLNCWQGNLRMGSTRTNDYGYVLILILKVRKEFDEIETSGHFEMVEPIVANFNPLNLTS